MIQLTGYEVLGPAGFGASGTAWNVRGADGTPAVAIRTPASAQRLASLQALRHAHLPEIISVHRASDGGVMVMEMIAGHSLSVIMGARGWASHAEIAGLWRDTADALAALHHRGIVHGDVSPANILIADDARPVLIDIGGHDGRERGHVGFIPPEGEAGPSMAGDVWSLARTLLWASGGDPRVSDALHAALGSDPEGRPSAREFSLSWQRLGVAEALTVPAAPRLAEAGMRAAEADTWLAAAPPSPRWWRPVVVAAALGVGLGVASVLASGGQVDAITGDPSAVQHVQSLIRARDVALSERDEDALRELYTGDGAATSGDLERLAVLTAGEVVLDGYETTVHGIEVREQGERRTVVDVTIAPSAHVRVHSDGVREAVGVGAERCVRVTLESERLSAIGPCT
ncbi:MAG: protein kinase [Ruaniaceae bacterium]|nr:protein kinase [Ruaniaceae bacterium]